MFSFKLWVYFKMINSLIFYYTTFEFFHMFILIKYKFRNDSLGDIMWKHEKCPVLGERGELAMEEVTRVPQSSDWPVMKMEQKRLALEQICVSGHPLVSETNCFTSPSSSFLLKGEWRPQADFAAPEFVEPFLREQPKAVKLIFVDKWDL